MCLLAVVFSTPIIPVHEAFCIAADFMCLFFSVPKQQQTLPESRFASNKGDSISASSEKNSKAEPKAEAGAKARSSSNTPTSPKPPLQSTKPSLAGRPTVPQKPRSASRTGEELFWAVVIPSPECFWMLFGGAKEETPVATSWTEVKWRGTGSSVPWLISFFSTSLCPNSNKLIKMV